jgi:hypothetical protein
MRAIGWAIFVMGGTAAMAAAQRPAGFTFDPQPRWAEEAETEQVCGAIAKECTAQLKEGSIEADWGYAEYYDAGGYLVGLKSVKSTGCRPLDEHMLLGHRHFRTVFSKDDAPDLDGITAELAPGTSRDAVRLVKRGETSVSMGC